MLELIYLSIVEQIEKNLVEILIQRQNTELNLFEIQQSTINNRNHYVAEGRCAEAHRSVVSSIPAQVFPTGIFPRAPHILYHPPSPSLEVGFSCHLLMIIGNFW